MYPHNPLSNQSTMNAKTYLLSLLVLVTSYQPTTAQVMADFHVTPRWTIKAGVEPAYRVKAGAKNGNRNVDFTKHVNKFDLTIPIGASFDITRHWVVEARLNLGVKSIMNADNTTVRNLATALSVGYRF